MYLSPRKNLPVATGAVETRDVVVGAVAIAIAGWAIWAIWPRKQRRSMGCPGGPRLGRVKKAGRGGKMICPQ